MPDHDFNALLARARRAADSVLMVGLDPDPARFPPSLAGRPDALFEFCRAIVDATADLVCAFKPQIAYFAAERGEAALEALIEHIHRRHPGVPVILDAKRGDIGSTAQQYAREAFERYRADAVTVNPYMGFDTVEPYLAYPGKGVFLLCRTSNPGAAELQGLSCGGEALYERVARLAAGPWNRSGRIGLVVGATAPAELARVRALVGPMPLLVPGIGAQGGDVEQTVRSAITRAEDALLLNSSRAILYAGAGEDFDRAARAAAEATRTQINRALAALSARD